VRIDSPLLAMGECGSSMLKFLYRDCHKCKDYLGGVVRDPPGPKSEISIDAYCVVCGFKLGCRLMLRNKQLGQEARRTNMKRMNTYEIALVLFVLISLLIAHSVAAQGTQFQRKICLELSDPEIIAICLTTVGNSLGAIGDLKEAEQAFRDAIRILPDSKTAAHAYSSLGGILGRQKKYDEAIVALHSALAINPTLGSAWSDLGVVYALIGRIDKAIYAYKQSISVAIISEVMDDAYLNLTFLYLHKNDSTNTKQTYQILYKRNPELAAKLLAVLKGDSKLEERFQRFIK